MHTTIRSRLFVLLALTFGLVMPAAHGITLELRIDSSDIPYTVGQAISIELWMVDVGAVPAAGYQAFLAYDTDEMTLTSGAYTPQPFGLYPIPQIVAVDGAINLSAGIDNLAGQTATTADALLATLEFETLIDGCGPSITFRTMEPPTAVSDLLSQAILPLQLIGLPSPDCNGNGINDTCDIASGFSPDLNLNGIPDECECPWDFTGPEGVPDGVVGVPDFFALLQNWGPCPALPDACPWDTTGGGDVPDGVVGVPDFFALLQNWGPCP